MSDRQAALDMALKQIEKQFGKGSIMKLGEQTDRKISTSPSGSLALDAALGVGGYPRGRIVEIYGPESSGKTTVALHAIAEVQAAGDRLHLLMLSMPLILYMPRSLASTLMSFFFPSRIQASRPLKLPKRLSEAEL